MKDLTIHGHKISKWYAVGGLGGGILVFILVRRARNSAGGTSADGTQAGTDPVTGLPYAQDNQTDPVTGMTYLAEAQQYGSVAAADAAFQDSTASQADGGVLDSGFPTGLSGDGGSGTGTLSFASNAQWSQAVTAGLTGVGYSSTDIAAALGLYFQGQPLGTASDGASYLQIIQAAVAEFGPPPVGTYPITGAPTSGGTGSGSGGGGTGGGGGGSTPPAKPLKTIGTRTVSATGKQDLQAVATSHGTTEDIVELMNPALAKKWAGTGKDLPKGTSVKIPTAPCTVTAAPGGEDLQKVANANGITEASAIALNPGLARYTGSGTYLPAGTKIVV